MKQNWDLLKVIKKINWDNRTQWLEENPGGKFLSTYAINGALQPPKDWDEMARKCSNNPNHQHFGKSVEEIRKIWSTKSEKGADRGNTLDDYITAILTEKPIDTSTFDANLLIKCKQFDELHTNVLSKLTSYVGSEIWLNSYESGLAMRLDSLFTINNDKSVVVGEWKNTESISTENRWEKLMGPASHLQNTDLNKYTIQTHLNRFALEEMEIFDKVQTRIFNFSTNLEKAKPITGFDYDKQFVIDIIAYAKEKQAN